MQPQSPYALSVVILSVPPPPPFSLPQALQPNRKKTRIIYALFLLLTLYSLYPTASQRHAHRAHLAAKRAEREKYAFSPSSSDGAAATTTAEQQWQHMWELQQLPRTPGVSTTGVGAPAEFAPLTPRTRAFQSLGGEYPAYTSVRPGDGV